MKIFIRDLIDVIKIYKFFRKIRWKDGCHCLFCGSNKIHKKGWHSRHEGCQRYKCLKCHRQFDDLTGTIFSGRHQSVVVWVLYCYFMSLNRYGFNSPPLAAMKLGYDVEAGNFQSIPRPLAAG